MKGNTDLAIQFLEMMYPEDMWCLTAIAVDRKGIKTETFGLSERGAARAFIDKYNGERNLYFHVNPPRAKLTKKAEREDIARVCYLHVDVDPRVGEDLEEEQKRALRILQNPADDSIPKPTIITFSGGGYQAFWRLAEAIEINGELALAEEAKLYNMYLEQVFGADNCHNIDRLMRIPGSVNVPDTKKRNKGRVEALAELVEHHPDRVYKIQDMPKAQQVQIKELSGFSGGGAKTVKVSGNVERLGSVDELDEWNVPDRVRVAIVQGHDPDNPKDGDNSRSAWVFDVCCQLIRCGVPDEKIFAILTDPDFGISSSILDKGTSAEKYAIRQIERAKEEAVDPWLRRLNELHAVIENLGGRCKIVEEIFDPALKRSRLTQQSFGDFQNRYKNKYVQVGQTKEGLPIMKEVGKWWVAHPSRREYKTLVFSPGNDVPGSYNLWKGFACEPRKGDCSLFLEHIKTNICGGNEEYNAYMLGWLARMIQNPDSPGQTAIVLRGKQGTGKSFFVKQVGALLGRHFMQVSDPKHLVGSFNAHLRDTILLFGDEAFYAGDKKHESVLKMLITEEIITIESKGVDAEAAPNYVHCILASNSQWVVPAGAEERRFFVLDVGDSQQQNPVYFRQIAQQMDNGGREALLHFLLNYDIKDYEVRKIPKTEALREQKLLSLTAEEEWWYSKLVDGRLLFDKEGWLEEVMKDDLYADYIDYVAGQSVYRRANRTALGKFVSRVCPTVGTKQKGVKLRKETKDGFVKEYVARPYFYVMPSLHEARAQWDKMYGEEKWPKVDESQQIEMETDDIPF